MLAVAASLVLFFLVQLTPSSVRARQLPNIVVILLDDVGYGDFGFTGHPAHETVQIDRRASEGMIFTDLYSMSPLCSPSRASLLTGRLPPRNGFYTNNEKARNSYTPQNIVGGIQESEFLIPKLLKSKGYRSSYIGKWHMGHQFQYLPLQHGFDEFFGATDVHFGPFDNVQSPNIPVYRGNKMLGRFHEDFPIENQMSNFTQVLKQEAIDFMKRTTDRPFHLIFTPDSTHAPTFRDKTFSGVSKRDCSYGDALVEMDSVVGELFNTIESLPHTAKNTWVFFTSDNGASRQSRIEGGSNFPFLCGKETTFEGGMRSPTFVWWPGRIRRRTFNRGPATLMDVFSTAIDLAGIPPPPKVPIDGRSLWNAMFAGIEDMSRPVYLWRGDTLMAIRLGNYKAHFWAWANGHDEYDKGIDFCPGEKVAGLTTRQIQDYTHYPRIINLSRDSGERFPIQVGGPEYRQIAPRMRVLYHEHIASVVLATPQLNYCDRAVENWAPPGCQDIGRCLPIPPSTYQKCGWPH